MPFLFDLHVHTSRGSSDSSLQPQELVAEAQRLGLHGVCLTEHGGPWEAWEFQRLTLAQGLLLVRAMEVQTDVGHMLAFGLDSYWPGIAQVQELRRVVNEVGGFLVMAHPFRGLFQRPLLNRPLLYPDGQPLPQDAAEAATHLVFGLVDAVEVANGGTDYQENRFALEVAGRLGLKATGGSDAHSLHGLGRCLTIFEDEIHSQEEFLQALRGGRYYPAQRLPQGELRPFTL
ncbi:MAG: CehA/McbA family metallohydrolase [Dehalococcoidia bacterium]